MKEGDEVIEIPFDELPEGEEVLGILTQVHIVPLLVKFRGRVLVRTSVVTFELKFESSEYRYTLFESQFLGFIAVSHDSIRIKLKINKVPGYALDAFFKYLVPVPVTTDMYTPHYAFDILD